MPPSNSPLPATLPAGAIAPPPPDPAAHLSRSQKAAILVRLLLNEGAKISLADLPDSSQVDLTEQMGSLRLVRRDTLRAIAAEFLAELEAVGMTMPGGIEGALSTLDGTISTRTAQRMRKEIGLKAIVDPWERLAGLNNERLLPILENESIEVGAVVLSKLKVSKSAELLAAMPGDTARRIAYAMSLTGCVTPDAVERIGSALASQLDAEPISAFDGDPVERIGAILNYSPSRTREDVLDSLDENDAEFAIQVRRAIFTFANIPARVNARDIAKVLRNIDSADVVTALTSARARGLGEAVDHILSNISKRLSEGIEEEIAERGNVKEADGEVAMNAIVAEIRTLEQDGEIFLIAEDDAED